MAVTLTSPVLGQDVDYVYTGPLESWLLAEGYARQDGYTGPGVSNTGPTSIEPGQDPLLPENRDEQAWGSTDPATNVTIANDAENLNKQRFPAPGFDFDPEGVDDDAPANVTLDVTEGAAAGGATVTLSGDNLEGVTDVTFGGTSATTLVTDGAAEGSIVAEVPAGTAGPVDVVLVDPDGNTTLEGGFTYTA